VLKIAIDITLSFVKNVIVINRSKNTLNRTTEKWSNGIFIVFVSNF